MEKPNQDPHETPPKKRRRRSQDYLENYQENTSEGREEEWTTNHQTCRGITGNRGNQGTRHSGISEEIQANLSRFSIHVRVDQDSEEWHEIRKSMLITCSNMHIIMGSWKNKTFSKYYQQKRYKLPETQFTNAAILWGKEQEPEARQAYEAVMNTQVDLCGFFMENTTRKWGGSPDGINKDGTIIEIKCPYSPFDGTIKSQWVHQMAGLVLLSGKNETHLIVYCPMMDKLHVYKLVYDQHYLDEMRTRIDAFVKMALRYDEGMDEKVVQNMKLYKPEYTFEVLF